MLVITDDDVGDGHEGGSSIARRQLGARHGRSADRSFAALESGFLHRARAARNTSSPPIVTVAYLDIHQIAISNTIGQS
jgi:hypothetical protein